MKLGVVSQILKPYLDEMTDQQVLVLHVTHASSGRCNPVHMIGFESGLAYCWHVTQTADCILLTKAWEDVDDWTQIAVEGTIEFDQLKIKVSEADKAYQHHKESPSLMDLMAARAFEDEGRRPS